MKEILKYLRNLHSYSQTDISQKLGISRQSYFKYESGSIVPPAKIVQKLAEIYNVDQDFILKNQVPALPKKKEDFYDTKESELEVASPRVKYGASAWGGQKTYDAYFDGNTVRVLDGSDAAFTKGQRFKLVEVSEDDEAERKRNAFQTLLKFRGSIELPADFDYKKELIEALEEKYDSAD